MAREASYAIISSREEKEMLLAKKANDQYQLTRRYNKMSNLQLLNEVVNGKDVSEHLHISNNKDSWREIYNNLNYKNTTNKETKETYKGIIETILAKSDTFISRIENTRSISTIAFYYLFKLNDIENWEPKRNNPAFQLDSLIEHLFAKYKVPKFLYKGFHNSRNATENHRLIELFLHFGSGSSLKKFTNAPKLKLNNRVYHHLFSAPEELDMYQAFRRAQILSMGGDKWLFDTLMDSKLHSPTTATQDEFWVTLIQFFITNTMVSEKKIKEIIDYIDDQKFQRRIVNGVWQDPPSPNFSMKGRTVDSLIRLSDNWHKIQAEAARLNRIGRVINRPGVNRTYTPTPIRDFSWEKAQHIKGYYNNSKAKEVYDIIELTNSRQLRDQSSAQRNCVYSYASQCAAGTCRIFTLRLNNEPILTLQLSGYKLVQIKGKCNRQPTESEMNHVRRWVEKDKLAF